MDEPVGPRGQVDSRLPGSADPDRADGGPGTGATLVWNLDADTEPVLARLRELTRGRAIVEPE